MSQETAAAVLAEVRTQAGSLAVQAALFAVVHYPSTAVSVTYYLVVVA